MHTLTRDGVSLAYVEHGVGDPPILLVHGWCCDHTFLQPQVDAFSRTHRVVAVDLRGHGASDAPQQDYTMSGFADDLAWMIDELGLAPCVVIGHAMGAIPALALAAHSPTSVRGVVSIDSTLVPTEERRRFILERVAPALQGSDYLPAMRALIEQMFLPTDDPLLKRQIIDQMTRVPQHVLLSAGIDTFAWDAAPAAAACQAPVLVITASQQPVLEPLREHLPDVIVGQIVGAGHFCQLVVPLQVNAMIERFLEINGFAAEKR